MRRFDKSKFFRSGKFYVNRKALYQMSESIFDTARCNVRTIDAVCSILFQYIVAAVHGTAGLYQVTESMNYIKQTS